LHASLRATGLARDPKEADAAVHGEAAADDSTVRGKCEEAESDPDHRSGAICAGLTKLRDAAAGGSTLDS